MSPRESVTESMGHRGIAGFRRIIMLFAGSQQSTAALL